MATTKQTLDHADDGGLLPPRVRAILFGIIGLLMAFAGYLLLVRGPALLLDLAHSAAAMFCL